MVAGRCSFAVWLMVAAGCQQNPYVAPQTAAVVPGQPQQFAQVDRRADLLDANNRDLHAQLARSQQQVQVLQDEVTLLREQLTQSAGELRDLLVAKKDSDERLQAIETSTRLRGGATITANNSLRDQLPQANLPGIEVRRDGDLIRIEVPADRLFHHGSAQLLPTASPVLDQVAAAISRSYRQQMIGIEGHTDSMSLGGGSRQQLSSAQSLAIYEYMTLRNQIPSRQLFTVGYGEHRPLLSNATPAGRARNRRVEIVIYPETIDGI